jgi:hypothetical protein
MGKAVNSYSPPGAMDVRKEQTEPLPSDSVAVSTDQALVTQNPDQNVENEGTTTQN